MKNNWRDELAARYPSLYKDYKGDPRYTCMAWGLEVGNGWQEILEELSEAISKIDPEGKVKAEQVKEKFGTLSFYFSSTEDLREQVWALVRAAEEKSAVTCEKCGAPGKRRGGGWIKTLCDDCDKKD